MPLWDGGKRILLASRSPRRHQLLSAAGFDFVTVEPGVEPGPTDDSARRQCEDSARAKALGAGLAGRSGILLAVDTVVSLDGRSLGKPRDREEAALFLDQLSGRSHEVLTAHAHAPAEDGICGGIQVLVSSARVAFRDLDAEEREAYLDGDDWQDKAGGYGIQSQASSFARLVEGDLDTVIGLSLRVVRQILALHA